MTVTRNRKRSTAPRPLLFFDHTAFQAEIDEIEEVIRKKIAQRRKAIKPIFQDFDRRRTSVRDRCPGCQELEQGKQEVKLKHLLSVV